MDTSFARVLAKACGYINQVAKRTGCGISAKAQHAKCDLPVALGNGGCEVTGCRQ